MSQIKIDRPISKNLADAIACFTFPTKQETAENYSEHFYINYGGITAFRVWNAAADARPGNKALIREKLAKELKRQS